MKQQNQQNLSDAAFAQEGSQARARLMSLFDESTFVEIDRLVCYQDTPAGVVAGYGTVEGCPVYAFAQDRSVRLGAVGKAEADKIRKIYELAAQNGAPVVGIFDSDGAKLEQGIDALDSIAEILLASNNISGVVPQIAVVAGACVGSASVVAANADIVVAVKGTDYYLNPGDGNEAADILAESADAAVKKARALIALLPSNTLSPPLSYDSEDGAMRECRGDINVIEEVADAGSLIVLGEGVNKTALARVDGVVCGLVALSETRLSQAEASRIARFVRLCDGFSIPVVTFVDFEGFDSVKGAAQLSHAYAEATTVKITVVAGKAYGAAYIAVAGKPAGADVVLAWPSAVILPLPPEAAIHIFWQERLKELDNPVEGRKKLAEEYAKTEGNAVSAAQKGYVTDVIPQDETKSKLSAVLDMMSGKRVSRLPKKHSNILL